MSHTVYNWIRRFWKKLGIILLLLTVFSYAFFHVVIVSEGISDKYFNYPEATYKMLETEAKTEMSLLQSEHFRSSEMVFSTFDLREVKITVTADSEGNVAIVRDYSSKAIQISVYETIFFIFALVFTILVLGSLLVGLVILYIFAKLFDYIRIKTTAAKEN